LCSGISENFKVRSVLGVHIRFREAELHAIFVSIAIGSCFALMSFPKLRLWETGAKLTPAIVEMNEKDAGVEKSG
jgi:hypothetical protein